MEATKQAHRFDRLINAVQELSLARDLGTVMEIVSSVSQELTGAQGATFILRDGDQCFYAAEKAVSPLFKGQRFPLQTCVSGWSMLHRQALMIEDIYTDARVPLGLYKPTFVKSLLIVPIRTLDPIGAIGNYWAERHRPSGEEISVLQALADITAVSIENIKVYTELEERVKQRTMELEQMNKELEDFSYSVSHDLRAPLRAINGYMEMLMEDHSTHWSEEAKKLAGRVHANARDMTELINSLLMFFRMGKINLDKTQVDLAELVPKICDYFKDQEKDRDIQIKIHQLPRIWADRGLIQQLWQNLISNAVKYTGKNAQALIEIGSEKKDGKVLYYIKDNGVGFDMTYYDKLFGMFQRLHSQREFEGSGIGLATVEKIVNKHGGRVWADAKVNEGATFYFTLD